MADKIATKTGKKAYLWLIEVDSVTGNPTGRRKLNISTDPDYIAPIENLGMCPISSISWKGIDPVCETDVLGHNTGFQVFLRRERLIDGISDGYIEDNIQDSNYVSPILNPTNCPIPS